MRDDKTEHLKDKMRTIMDLAFDVLLENDVDLLDCVTSYCAEMIVKHRPDRESGITEAIKLIRETVEEIDDARPKVEGS
jgi:hypothetical protein